MLLRLHELKNWALASRATTRATRHQLTKRLSHALATDNLEFYAGNFPLDLQPETARHIDTDGQERGGFGYKLSSSVVDSQGWGSRLAGA